MRILEKRNKFKGKEFSVRFPDVLNLGLRQKWLCRYCPHVAPGAQASWRGQVQGGGWAGAGARRQCVGQVGAHLQWPGRGLRCTPGSCSRHSHRALRTGRGTRRPPPSTLAAPPPGGPQLPAAVPRSRAALPAGTRATGRKGDSAVGRHSPGPSLPPPPAPASSWPVSG